ncbi:KN motif and ankyrin repeat domain-containing protein 4-like isoform X2 [Gambusia affinis]|uniref:KN motif and ankyrin repeat domain-containing protein 4-like isoform X2 n=1 Tax=Gambusia affinis TaxID=33528 RepID=UPI001CDB94CD|nr:KN motif and ankyrin repeat domain-containing protein 4-like isoform X2 [Gambusia affinis]
MGCVEVGEHLKHTGLIARHKMAENGVKGKPSYSVETPYGFQIDLDFLKYVDDIEKGNTIKRVPIQRRSKGLRASTLPRHLNSSGSSYQQSPWRSTGALDPRSRRFDNHHHGCSSWIFDHRPPLSPTGLTSLTEMEARIKEFDEQPLGEHIRPHLLRASSLPLTVLLRQESESKDDRSSIQSSRDHLGGRNTSCEDVFLSDSPRPQDCSGLLRRLTEALERVGELEMEVRVVSELRAQICILQEERERLRLGLVHHVPPSTVNGTTDLHTSSLYGKGDVLKSQRESHIMFPRNHSVTSTISPVNDWKTSTDLDELLTVTSLQAKVAVLEQKLHDTEQDLQRTVGLLKEQQQESRRKDEKIEYLIRNPGVWVRAERVVVDQEGDETFEPERIPASSVITRTVPSHAQRHQDSIMSDGGTDMFIIRHIKRIKSLLDQQWECVCGEFREKGKPLKHPDPKVNSLQQEMMELVDVLMSGHKHHEDSDGQKIQNRASKSTLESNGSTQTLKKLQSKDANEGVQMSTKGSAIGQDNGKLCGEASVVPRGMEATQVDVHPPKRRVQTDESKQTCPEGRATPVGAISGHTDGGTVLPEKKSSSVLEDRTGSNTKGREILSADFISACHFVKDHMDITENPDDDMRKALVTMFQHWFGAAAEEASETSRVAAYLKEVKSEAPPLLAFLVNLADDNGNTVLHYSVSHCNYGVVSLLLDTGMSDVNVQNNAGYTAVMLASLTAPDGPAGMEVVRKLMELGNVNTRSSQTGQTALHLAVRHGRVVMVRLLLSCGADANIQDNQGMTSLMYASERGHTHIARLLLERSQCDLTLTDKRGQTALSIAKQGSHSDTATLLQAHAKARAL